MDTTSPLPGLWAQRDSNFNTKIFMRLKTQRTPHPTTHTQPSQETEEKSPPCLQAKREMPILSPPQTPARHEGFWRTLKQSTHLAYFGPSVGNDFPSQGVSMEKHPTSSSPCISARSSIFNARLHRAQQPVGSKPGVILGGRESLRKCFASGGRGEVMRSPPPAP